MLAFVGSCGVDCNGKNQASSFFLIIADTLNCLSFVFVVALCFSPSLDSLCFSPSLPVSLLLLLSSISQLTKSVMTILAGALSRWQ